MSGHVGSEDEAAPVTKADFGCLLTAMVGIQEQIQSMKRELAEEREAANEQLGKIATASDCLGATLPVVERAREALKEGEDLI